MYIKLFVLLNIFFNPLQEVAFKISLRPSYVCEERNYKGVIHLACGIDPWKTQHLTASEERSWTRHEPGWLSGIAKFPEINFCAQNQQGPYMIGMTINKDTISSEDQMYSMKSLKNQHWPCTIEMSINKEMFISYEVASKNSLKNQKWPYMIEMIINKKMIVSNEVISKEFLQLWPYTIGMAINKEMIISNDVASKESSKNQQWPNTIEMTINKEMIVYNDKVASKDYLKIKCVYIYTLHGANLFFTFFLRSKFWSSLIIALTVPVTLVMIIQKTTCSFLEYFMYIHIIIYASLSVRRFLQRRAKTYNDWENPAPLINLNGSQVQNNENSLTLWNEISFSAEVSTDAINTPEEVAFSLQSIILETHPEVTIFDYPLETMAFDTTQENKESLLSTEVSTSAMDTPKEDAFSLQSILLETHPEMTKSNYTVESAAFDITHKNKESTSFPAEDLTSVVDSLEDSLSLKPVTLKINPEVDTSSKLVEKTDINKTKEDNQTSSRMDNLPIVQQPTSSTPVVMFSRRDPPSRSNPFCFGCCPYSKTLDY